MKAVYAVIGIVHAYFFYRVYNGVYEPFEENLACSREFESGQSEKSLFKTTNLNNLLPLANDELPYECFFSQNYADARARFRSLADKAGAHQMLSFNVPEVNHYSTSFGEVKVSSDNDTYTTDVAIFKGDPKRQLWHLSGTHGE